MRISCVILSTVLFGSGVFCAAGDQAQEPGQRVSLESLSSSPRGSDDSDVPHPPPGTVVVVGTILTDNGDGDDWADTNETIRMQITLYNRMGFDLTGVVATLQMDDPAIACVSIPTIVIGNLADRETTTSTDAFIFTVADIDRTSVTQTSRRSSRLTYPPISSKRSQFRSWTGRRTFRSLRSISIWMLREGSA